MSHYLSHMAALAVNHTPVVQPRLASRFEGFVGAAPAEDFQEFVSDASLARPVTRPVDVPGSAAHAEAGIAPAAVLAKSPAPLLLSQPVSQVAPAVAEPLLQTTPAPKSQVLVQELIQERIHEQPLLIATPALQAVAVPVAGPAVERPGVEKHTEQSFFTELHHELVASVAPESQPVKVNTGVRQEATPVAGKTSHIQTRIAAPEQSARPTIRQQAQPAETAAPTATIQVSIGRIEIRANPASNPHSPKSQAKSSTLSLDDYLKQRKGDR